MKLAVLTPLPPTRTGIAHYASMLLPALARRAEVRAFESLEGYRPADFDAVVYQLGNNPHHETAYLEAMRVPGVIVLHDLVLHHLIVEMTLARGDVEGYSAALRANHGAMGEAWARGRAAGLHLESANFLMPASIEVANRSLAVIVHNNCAAERLRSFGVSTPIHVVPHPYVPETRRFDRDALRARFDLTPGDRVIGFFGHLTSAKRADVVLEAFRRARQDFPRLALLVVGEPAPNIDLERLRSEGVVMTGYVPDDEFPSYYAAADRLVNLRYPTAGETSGTLIRALDAGKPVAVSDYAQFAELPDTCVVKIPLGDGEVEALAGFFMGDVADPAGAQRTWLEENARLDLTADGYMTAIAEPRGRAAVPPTADRGALLPLFPSLELVEARIEERVTLTLKNTGDQTMRTHTYGVPEYRLIAKLFDGERYVGDRWLALPCDLHPGQTATLSFESPEPATSVRLLHAIQDVPMLEPEPFATAEAGRVR